MTNGPFKEREKPATAREIVEAEKKKQATKTARLREARLEKEAAEAGEQKPEKPRRTSVKANGRKR